ncbi:MAG: 8-amino-7-oxononanoate synthase [Cyclobacteriaceae bacterium]|nr:8-amino-7-oxononanoate synthase [Cyclobacteriaceae bacterium]
MTELSRLLEAKLKQRQEENSLRKLTNTSGLVDFTSNDYLGLARSEELFQRINEQLKTLPQTNGASGSRLLSGNSQYIEQVEQKLATIFKSEAALIFNSGYAANQGVLACIPRKGDTIIYDELVHACIRDGIRLSFAKHFSFKHNDLSDLEKKLKRSTGSLFIAVESIYSMDGDECPLQELVALAKRYNAHIILDEAHSTGVIGPDGAGMAVSQGIEQQIAIRIYTFGKAMGCHGACVAGSKTLIDYLINFARPFIFTTAMPNHNAAAIDCSFQFLKSNIDLQNTLQQKINLFVSLGKEMKLNTLNSNTQIQGVVLPGNNRVKTASEKLRSKGFDIRPILSPTVPKGSERLRICLHTFNSDEEIRNLISELAIIE